VRCAVRHGRRVARGAAPAPPGEAGAALRDERGAALSGEPAAAASAEPAALPVRLTAGDELLAVAEPRGDELQPVVVFSPA
jgi:hypothetical protein